MSLKQLSIRVEISFWQMVIQLLSESRFLQSAISRLAEVSPRAWRICRSLERDRLARCASIGFAGGFLIGLGLIIL